jgi:thymidylate synthase (FAD)
MNLTQDQQDEIKALRDQSAPTRRAVSPGLEAILYEPMPVLDHGFVRVVDYMGDDAAIVQAARVSYGRGTRKVSDDRGLIRYLMRHYHSTPFEMCEIKYHVKLPIFVARQWIRHRTANVNEYSARYSVLDKEFYIPAPEQLAAQSASNRQGRGDVVTGDEAALVLDLLRHDAEKTYRDYAWMLNEGEDGAADAQHLYAVVLENRPAQSDEFPPAARRRPCAIRNPRLCRRDDRDAECLGAAGG